MLSPLAWGLGHASRSVPIVKLLQNNGFNVILAANRSACFLFERELHNTTCIKIPGFEVRYSRFLPLMLSLVLQFPLFLVQVFIDRIAISYIIKKYDIDIIISDNRFCFKHPKTYNIYLTHQVNIALSKKLFFLEKAASKFHQLIIKKYHELWIPDYPGNHALAAKLSDARPVQIKYRYVGHLSRFNTVIKPPTAPKYKFAFVLSGPEPQRSMLEKIIVDFFNNTNTNILIIRGLTTNRQYPKTSENICFMNYADTQKLIEVCNSAEIMVSRSGYSSIMDWVALGTKTILIPTPGQSEQAYIARHLQQKSQFVFLKQADFNQIEKRLDVIKKYIPQKTDSNLLENAIRDLNKKVIY